MACHGGYCSCAGLNCAANETCCGASSGDLSASVCIDLSASPGHCGACGQSCGAGERCFSGHCGCGELGTEGQIPAACTSQQACCQNQCVDPGSNLCECAPGVYCTGGQSCCNGNCVNLLSDKNHCGTCNNACSSNQKCESGQCKKDGCQSAATPSFNLLALLALLWLMAWSRRRKKACPHHLS